MLDSALMASFKVLLGGLVIMEAAEANNSGFFTGETVEEDFSGIWLTEISWTSWGRCSTGLPWLRLDEGMSMTFMVTFRGP